MTYLLYVGKMLKKKRAKMRKITISERENRIRKCKFQFLCEILWDEPKPGKTNQNQTQETVHYTY